MPNLVLLCHRHHWMAHEGKWQVVKADDGRILAIPPQLDIAQRFARGPTQKLRRKRYQASAQQAGMLPAR